MLKVELEKLKSLERTLNLPLYKEVREWPLITTLNRIPEKQGGFACLRQRAIVPVFQRYCDLEYLL